VFGKIKLDDFNPKKIEGLVAPKFTGPVDYSKMIDKMSDAKYHIAIGDNMYPDFEMISQRVYEAIMAGCLVFIDKDFDKNKRVFGNNKILSDFLYVSDRKEVYERIKELDDGTLNTMRTLQHLTVGFNEKEYCDGFVKLIEETT
jgi:hypothetical protein